MKTVRLIADALVKWFDQGGARTVVLNGVTAVFHQGVKYAIIGPSGAGKSTLLHILAGIDTPTTGEVSCNEMGLSYFSAERKSFFLNKTVGLVFQFPYLIRELSVLENVMIPGLIAQKPYAYCVERAQYLLEEVGIPEKAKRTPASLSGGQQQRVSLARALFNEPAFLLADEPTGNLDTATGKEMLRVMLACQEKYTMGIIVNTHDEYIADAMQEVYELSGGKLIKKR